MDFVDYDYGHLHQRILINTLRSRQYGCHSPDDILKVIFFYENFRIFSKIALKFVSHVSIKNGQCQATILTNNGNSTDV